MFWRILRIFWGRIVDRFSSKLQKSYHNAKQNPRIPGTLWLFDFGIGVDRCPCFWSTGTNPSIETRSCVNFQRLSPCGNRFFQMVDFGQFSLFFVIFRHFSKFLDRRQTWKRSESFRVVCVKDKATRYPWESGPHVRILTKSQQNLWFVSKILGAATPRHQNTILKNSPGMVGLLALRKRFPTHWKRSKTLR